MQGLTVKSAAGDEILSDISFNVRAGEVLGIGGLMGAGRTELLMHLFGALGTRTAGKVILNGDPLPAKTKPSEAVRRGLVLVSEDRKRYGLVLDQSIGFNLSLSSLSGVSRGHGVMGMIDRTTETRRNRELFDSLRVKAPTLETRVGTLSGGNQQKIVIGKALMTGRRSSSSTNRRAASTWAPSLKCTS